MRHFRSLAIASSTAIAGLLGSTPAQAYPIDCAILLCLAGGFPASAECTAAKAEFIRRITPWPIEPPLQLWRCPMGISPSLAAKLSLPPTGPDGLTPEVRSYRDAIEIYHIQAYYHIYGDNDDTIDVAQVGRYGEDGSFSWARASYEQGPSWLAEAVGGRTVAIKNCVRENRDGYCQEEQIIGSENREGPGWSRLRGVALRYQDHTGGYHTEWVKY